MYKNKVIHATVILYLLAFMASFALKTNFIVLLGIGIIGLVFTFIAIKNEEILIISGLIISFFFYGLKNISGILQYLPLYINGLMFIDILFKKKKLSDDLTLKYLISTSVILSLLPLILNLDFNIINIIYAMLKRYSFILIYIYIRCCELDYKYIDKVISKILAVSLLINIPFFLIQFINGVDRDFICGLFGDNMTGIICQLLLIQLCIKLKDYYSKGNIFNMFIWIIITIGYSAIAEVKFGFFVTAILLAGFFIFIEKKLKSVLMIGLISLLFLFGYNFYMQSYSHQDFMDKEFVKNYLVDMNYSGESVNRFGFVKKIDNAMANSTVDRLIGGGIGSGNPSNFNILRGSINKKYDYLKYYWFSLSYLYVENGFIGMTVMILIYLYILVINYINFKKYNLELSLLAFLISIINLMFMVYSDALVNYSSLFITWYFFALSTREAAENKEVVYEG